MAGGKAMGIFETAWLLGYLDSTFALRSFCMVSVSAQSIPARFKDFCGQRA